MAKSVCHEGTCPLVVAQNIIAGKWKLPILWKLSQGTKRFHELQKQLTEISQGILTRQLRELERDGLVHREVYKEVPPKVEYSLTETGQSFIPVLQAISIWGRDYLSRRLA
ncbi:helix-turn-helix transcriptional regulator|uniref:Transcriptional regulator, HxlR family n=1 Tax=Dendrosporobacter quercicolus TaxID=146817 RepID=A0A1G9YGP6_9FIRM|nr:helix-turn-helix domain-containing protein [Dendrosporobacter quercicolus]NSL47636.1 helix-turn-helix transcriptional regulator [Dendrosporobacter quercicolus DSM 1736]SDN07736.1 transcriptional regulator, HxlR family [Dendrosporobacter quercicolus]